MDDNTLQITARWFLTVQRYKRRVCDLIQACFLITDHRSSEKDLQISSDCNPEPVCSRERRETTDAETEELLKQDKEGFTTVLNF